MFIESRIDQANSSITWSM